MFTTFDAHYLTEDKIVMARAHGVRKALVVTTDLVIEAWHLECLTHRTGPGTISLSQSDAARAHHAKTCKGCGR